MVTPLRLSLFAALLLSLGTAQQPKLDDLLRRAAEYVERYHDQFGAIVAEEHYVQRLGTRIRPGAPLRPEPGRTLRSEFMLLDGIAPGGRWFAFRDVFEVDGEPIASQRGRLEAWLSESRGTLANRARRLALEQARYNLGDIVRTINTPLLPLEFLTAENQPRFRFRLSGSLPLDGVETAVVSYEERRRPTIIRTPEGRDVPASGRLWLEAGTGRVLMTELRTEARGRRTVRARITVAYAHNPRLEMLVPATMDEQYTAGAVEITGTATYSNYRRFETDARIKNQPPQAVRWLVQGSTMFWESAGTVHSASGRVSSQRMKSVAGGTPPWRRNSFAH